MNNMLAILVCVLIAAGITSPATAAEDQAVAILVVVNADTITTADLDKEIVALHSTQSVTERDAFEYRKLLEKLVNDRLIIQEATALGIHEESWLVELLDGFKGDNAVRYFVADKFKPDLAIDEADVYARFSHGYARLQLRTVSVKDSAEASGMAAAVRKGASMDSLARDVSLDVNRINGGLHSNKYRGDVEYILREHADTMVVGQVSDPFRYRNAYTFLRVEGLTPADSAEFEQRRPAVEKMLKTVANRTAWEEFFVPYAAKFPTVIDTLAIDTILADSALLFTQDFVNESKRPILTVAGGMTMTEQDVRTEVSRTAMRQGNQPVRVIVAEALDKAQEKMTLLAAAKEAGYYDDPRVMERYNHSRDSAQIEIYLKETVVGQIRFNHQEFQEYYDGHLDDFRDDTEYQLERIETKSEETAAEIAKRLSEGADFDFLARQYDPNPERKQQANEWVTLASFPESVQEKITQLQNGQTTDAIPTASGFVILRLRAKKAGEPKPLAKVEMRIREIMFQRKFNEQLDKALGVLRENATIEYNQAEIDEYFGADL